MSVSTTNKRLTFDEALARGLINRAMWRSIVGASRASPADRRELESMVPDDDAQEPHPEPVNQWDEAYEGRR